MNPLPSPPITMRPLSIVKEAGSPKPMAQWSSLLLLNSIRNRYPTLPQGEVRYLGIGSTLTSYLGACRNVAVGTPINKCASLSKARTLIPDPVVGKVAVRVLGNNKPLLFRPQK